MRRRIFMLLAIGSIAVVMLAGSETLPRADAAESDWSEWQSINDGHLNGIDVSIRVVRFGGDSRRHHVRVRSRYEDPLTFRLHVRRVNSNGEQVESMLGRVRARPGEVVSGAGLWFFHDTRRQLSLWATDLKHAD